MVQGGGSQLEAHRITVRFGGIAALEDVTLSLARDEVLGLIGPNGAGKTTLVNVLSGFQTPASGTIRLDDRTIDQLSPRERARVGLVRTFQSVRLFADLPVIKNVELAALARNVSRMHARTKALDLLHWIEVSEQAEQRASTLSYSDERRVGIARALALEPRYLLLDEPAAGMNESEAETLLKKIVAIPPTFHCGVLLIEHNFSLVMAAASRLHVLDFGRTLAEGSPAEIRANPRVLAAYLGEEEPGAADGPLR